MMIWAVEQDLQPSSQLCLECVELALALVSTKLNPGGAVDGGVQGSQTQRSESTFLVILTSDPVQILGGPGGGAIGICAGTCSGS
jgi:hypothetical protein